MVTIYELGVVVHYEGLLVHVDRAVATLDERGGPVEVQLRVENTGDNAADLNAPIRLTLGKQRFEPTRESHVPSIPAHGIAAAVMAFELQAISSVDLAIVEIGSEPQHVALVPLTERAGRAALYEPLGLVLSGTATSANLKLSLRAGLLRWDLPDWSQELVAGLQALTLTYDVTYTGDFAGGLSFTGENVALRLPDGSVIGPRRDGHSQSVELIGPKKTKKALFSRFEIPSGMTGDFALLVRNEGIEKAIPFAIGG